MSDLNNKKIEIKDLIIKMNLSKSLEKINNIISKKSTFRNEFSVIWLRFKSLEEENRKQIIPYNEYKAERNKITFNLLSLIDILNERDIIYDSKLTNISDSELLIKLKEFVQRKDKEYMQLSKESNLNNKYHLETRIMEKINTIINKAIYLTNEFLILLIEFTRIKNTKELFLSPLSISANEKFRDAKVEKAINLSQYVNSTSFIIEEKFNSYHALIKRLDELINKEYSLTIIYKNIIKDYSIDSNYIKLIHSRQENIKKRISIIDDLEKTIIFNT